MVASIDAEGMRTRYFWQYHLVIISCSYMLSDNGIVWFGPQGAPEGLVGCCQTMYLFDLVLSDNVFVWFCVVRQLNCLI